MADSVLIPAGVINE
jgi:hypothetical protein